MKVSTSKHFPMKFSGFFVVLLNLISTLEELSHESHSPNLQPLTSKQYHSGNGKFTSIK